MSYNELMDLIVYTTVDTTTLISLWGLANYFKEMPPIIYSSNMFGINFSVDVSNFNYFLAICATNLITLKNVYRVYKLDKR